MTRLRTRRTRRPGDRWLDGRGGTLDLGDAGPIPVNWDGDPNTAELAELLRDW